MFYRDKDEPLGTLTAERRKEITVKENGIYGKTNYSSYTRKEQSLKIFMDDHHHGGGDSPATNSPSDSNVPSCSNVTYGPTNKPDDLD